MTTGKTIALTRGTFVSKVMSLLYNMLSRLVITFLPRSKCLLISWLQSSSAVILEPKKIKSLTVSIVSPSICHEVMGPDAMILVFWILNFNQLFHRDSLIPLHFLPLRWCYLHIWSCWYFFQQSWFVCLQPARHFTWCALNRCWISRVTVYSLDILLSQFWTSPLVHVLFWLLLLDLHRDFSGGRYGSLVLLSL